MTVRVLLVGAGRMGLRHLDALAPLADEIVVVDPRPAARTEASARAGSLAKVTVAETLADVELDGIAAAVLAETSAGRPERVHAVAERVPELFVEKPLGQSRQSVRELVAAVEAAGARAVCHFRLRLLPLAEELRAAGGAVHIEVFGGAYGFACNGIHWIDLAVDATGLDGELLWGELDPRPIASGRGPEFRDYGGRAAFAFGESRLLMTSDPASSAPMLGAVTTDSEALFVDLQRLYVRRYMRDPASEKPVHLYGADYELSEDTAALVPPEAAAARWLRCVLDGSHADGWPTVAEAARAHELLFDLLEVGGESDFPIT